jgi:hypothetical protein
MRSTKPNKLTKTPREVRAPRVRIIRVLAQDPQPAVAVPILRAQPVPAWPWPALARSHPTLTQPISQPWLPPLDTLRPATRLYRRPHHLLLEEPTSTRIGRQGKF